MRCFTAQFFAAVLASSLQILAADTLFPYLVPSVDPTIGKEDLDCICQAFDAKSAFQEGSNQDKCAEDFNKILSANLAIISNNITLETCKDRRQQLPQDYCGYPNDLTPFSVDKDSSKLCSSTSDKEICAYQTFEQPDTPCYWSSGRQCYWNLTTATCQGTLSKWFIQAYGLSSDTETICSKQTTKSKCRSTYMLKEHCTSSSLDGEDRDKVCASQTELFACSQTRFSAVRACKWQAKFSGMEATHASCCTSSPYQRPLAGIIWCGFIGLSYVSDGRISSRIGIFTCDDVAGTFIRYQQSREIFLDMFGSAYVSKIDTACCTTPESLPGNLTVFVPQKPIWISMHPTVVSKPTSDAPIRLPFLNSRTPTRLFIGKPAAFYPNSLIDPKSPSIHKSTSHIPIKDAMLESRTPTRYRIGAPATLQPNRIIASQSPSIQKYTSYIPIQDALLNGQTPTRHLTWTPAVFKPKSIVYSQSPSSQKTTPYSPIRDALLESQTPTRQPTGTPAALQKSTSHIPIKDAMLESRTPTRYPVGAPAMVQPNNIIVSQSPSIQKSTSYVPIQDALLNSRTPARHPTWTSPAAFKPKSIVYSQSPTSQKTTPYAPIQDALSESQTPTRDPTGIPAVFLPTSSIYPQLPSNQPSFKRSRVNDPAINGIPMYRVPNPTTGIPTVRLNSTANATKAPFFVVQSPKSFNLSPTNGQLSDTRPSAAIQKPISVREAPTQTPSLHAQKYTSIPAPFSAQNGTVALKGSGKMKIGAAATALLALPLLGFFGYNRGRWTRQASGAKKESIDVNPDDL